jgi:hypothetical protein
MTTYEKAIHLQNKPLIPRDIIESDLSLQSYLEENVIQNRKDEKIRQRVAKAQRTRINHSLEAAARKIKVTQTNKPIEEIRRVDICKQPEPREGTLVTETIKGIIVICDHCGHRWTHHSANLGRQYYTQCSICRRNVRLKHYQ